MQILQGHTFLLFLEKDIVGLKLSLESLFNSCVPLCVKVVNCLQVYFLLHTFATSEFIASIKYFRT